MQAQSAAPKTYQNGNCPPRHNNSSHCGNNNISAAGLKQGDTMKSVALVPQPQGHFNPQQLEILKNSICPKGISNEEFEVFIMACTKTQLDPFMKQIYAIKRGDKMCIQTGIDGYRLIAERTGRYAPGPEPTYEMDKDGRVVAATSYIKKQTADGTWHTIGQSAYMDEYVQKTRDGRPMGMWGNMPRTMLSKVAESIALRKAFPAEMSGTYTEEEMQQSDVITVVQKISGEQANDLQMILDECTEDYRKFFYSLLAKKHNGSEKLTDIPEVAFEKLKQVATEQMHKNHAMQIEVDKAFVASEGSYSV